MEGIASGNMGVLVAEGVIVGTGCRSGGHITGVSGLPRCQKRGYSSRIMEKKL